jgi:ribonuclease-3
MFNRFRAYIKKRSLDSVSRLKIDRLEEIFGFHVQSPELYLRALRHRSTLIESQMADTESYEQLEFLGDAVLDLVITEIIFDYFPDRNEGFMTKLRSKLVKEESLAELSNKLGLASLIEVGNRVKSQGIELKKSVLSDIFEAVLGAIYLDSGIVKTRQFVRRVYDTHVNINEVSVQQDNYKSLLLEYTQANKYSVPEYRIAFESGPDHDKTFDIEAIVNDMVCGAGKGKNKKKAEQVAAMQALDFLRKRNVRK